MSKLDERDLAKRVGANIRAYRKFRALSQERLCVLLAEHGVNLSPGQISDTETGKRLNLRMIELVGLVRVLDCTFSDIIGYDAKGN